MSCLENKIFCMKPLHLTRCSLSNLYFLLLHVFPYCTFMFSYAQLTSSEMDMFVCSAGALTVSVLPHCSLQYPAAPMSDNSMCSALQSTSHATYILPAKHKMSQIEGPVQIHLKVFFFFFFFYPLTFTNIHTWQNTKSGVWLFIISPQSSGVLMEIKLLQALVNNCM